mmetsp:Transcript_34993/g.64808  ORF Transcript_34993/g.64808 Transcript_34993/m.64808 type:complete len:157 (-) Transcript_34993:214-684(-)
MGMCAVRVGYAKAKALACGFRYVRQGESAHGRSVTWILALALKPSDVFNAAQPHEVVSNAAVSLSTDSEERIQVGAKVVMLRCIVLFPPKPQKHVPKILLGGFVHPQAAGRRRCLRCLWMDLRCTSASIVPTVISASSVYIPAWKLIDMNPVLALT